jgi:hypothetical protein
VSRKQASKLREYYALRKAFLATHPVCEITGCGEKSVDLHHRMKRGKYLNDPRYFLAVCRPCHDRCHRNPAWARANGYLA